MLPDTEFDSSDTGLRDQVESSVVTHGHDPDAESVENVTTEHMAMVKREPDPSNVKDRLRAQIRNAITLHKARDSGHPAVQAPIDAPTTSSTEATASWGDLPHDVHLPVVKEQQTYQDTVQTLGEVVRRTQELDQVIAPHRERFPSGLSDAQVIGHLLDWQKGLNDPQTSDRYYALLGQQLRSLHSNSQSQPYQAQPYQYQPQPFADYSVINQRIAQQNERIEREFTQFAQDHPHFNVVRADMGIRLENNGAPYLLPDGSTDLPKLYRDVCRSRGLYAGGEVKHAAAAVLPPSRAPSAARQYVAPKGHDVRSSIEAAISEVRGGGGLNA
jgi:hypothetical protein